MCKKKSRHHFNIEAEGAKPIVTTDHGTHRILHPPVVEIALTLGQ